MYSCFYGPYWTFSVWQRHRISLVYSIRVESSSVMKSISCPFLSRYSPPSFIAWSLPRLSQYGPQSHCSLSLLILCQSLPSHSCPLCSNKGSRPSATQYPPFHHHHWCPSVSFSTIFSRALVGDPLFPHLWRTSFCRHQLIHSRIQV